MYTSPLGSSPGPLLDRPRRHIDQLISESAKNQSGVYESFHVIPSDAPAVRLELTKSP